MNITDIQLLFDHYYWATERILAAAEHIPPTQFISPSPLAGLPSLRATLLHALNAECRWRLRWQGIEPGDILTEQDLPTLASIKIYWQQQEREMHRLLTSYHNADLERHIEGVSPDGYHFIHSVWHSMMHVLFHGSQHRSEAAALLTSYGSSPGELDFFVFLHH